MRSRLFFLIGILFAVSPWASPPTALAAGLLFAFIAVHPYPQESNRASRFLLQASVVALGFGMNFHQVLRTGRSGLLYTALGIGFALGVGTLIGQILEVHRTPSFLISAGTAICGGSAIASRLLVPRYCCAGSYCEPTIDAANCAHRGAL
jgi:uncharacterized membrane protein YadS